MNLAGADLSGAQLDNATLFRTIKRVSVAMTIVDVFSKLGCLGVVNLTQSLPGCQHRRLPVVSLGRVIFKIRTKARQARLFPERLGFDGLRPLIYKPTFVGAFDFVQPLNTPSSVMRFLYFQVSNAQDIINGCIRL